MPARWWKYGRIVLDIEEVAAVLLEPNPYPGPDIVVKLSLRSNGTPLVFGATKEDANALIAAVTGEEAA